MSILKLALSSTINRAEEIDGHIAVLFEDLLLVKSELEKVGGYEGITKSDLDTTIRSLEDKYLVSKEDKTLTVFYWVAEMLQRIENRTPINNSTGGEKQ